MMKIELLLIGLLFAYGLYGKNGSSFNPPMALSPQDSTVISRQDEDIRKTITDVFKELNLISPRFKIYKTPNMYNLIRLDTATGAVWQVQYRMGATHSMILEIDDTSLLSYYDKEVPGRFELYETNNNYTFLLVDTVTGRIWQVQWSTNGPKERFRERIYE